MAQISYFAYYNVYKRKFNLIGKTQVGLVSVFVKTALEIKTQSFKNV